MDLRTFLILFHLCPGVGNINELRLAAFLKIYQRIPTESELKQLLKLSPKQITIVLEALKQPWLQAKLQANLLASQTLTILDKDYPLKLKESYQPPAVIFYQGDLNLLNKPLLAIVGARKADNYAKQALMSLIKPVVASGIITISGLALGVDSLCHQLTLQAGQKTIGVIGSGLDITYPKTNYLLQAQVAKEGLLLSEYPLGSPPLRFHFPERNRIIAGLCDSILVVEARHHSGSLITANLALQNNRNVLAIPGPITASLSQGCNELIAAGAKLVAKPADILTEFDDYLL